jgi:lysophospholipase L1-like esterase
MCLKRLFMSLAATVGLSLPAYAGVGPAHLLPYDRIDFYGDSITFLGMHDPHYNGWFNLFQQQVGNTMPITLFDSGVGGYTTTKGVQNFSRLVLSVHPSVVVIWLGINDIDTFTDPHITQVNIETMTAMALDAGVREVILVSPMGRFEKQDGGNSHDAAIDSLAAFMFDIAASDKSGRVFYMPMRAYFLNKEEAVNPDGNTGVLLLPDGLHPNGVGHQFIDQAFLTEFGLMGGLGAGLGDGRVTQPSGSTAGSTTTLPSSGVRIE